MTIPETYLYQTDPPTGLFCPRCGIEVAVSNNYCEHISFVIASEENDFSYVSPQFLPVAEGMRETIVAAEFLNDIDDDIDDDDFYMQHQIEKLEMKDCQLIICVVDEGLACGLARVETRYGFHLV